MSQIEKALMTKTNPSKSSTVQDYFPCEPYQKIANLKFRTVVPKDSDTATAIVQIDYEYTMSYLRVLDDLEAGKHATNYGRVSGKNLDSAEWLQRHTFDKGGHFIVDGIFSFVRTDNGWQLQ